MFSIFKSKPQLSSLIPNGFVDIHNHVLPGIDDGSKNISDSEYLISSMKQLGFEKIIATPHTYSEIYPNTKSTIQNSFNDLKKNLNELTDSVNLNFASEYFIDETFINKIDNDELLCLKDRYILVELSFLNAPIQLHDYLFKLQLKGYQPVLAHPERYIYYHNNLDGYKQLKKMGCKFQLNLLSTVGYYGNEIANVSEKLLQNNLIDFVGSDIHHKHHISSFERKVIIKSISELEKVIDNNQFFR